MYLVYIVHKWLCNTVYYAWLVFGHDVPVSQFDPVQPALQSQVSGDTHVPCTHGDVQMAVNSKIHIQLPVS